MKNIFAIYLGNEDLPTPRESYFTEVLSEARRLTEKTNAFTLYRLSNSYFIPSS